MWAPPLGPSGLRHIISYTTVVQDSFLTQLDWSETSWMILRSNPRWRSATATMGLTLCKPLKLGTITKANKRQACRSVKEFLGDSCWCSEIKGRVGFGRLCGCVVNILCLFKISHFRAIDILSPAEPPRLFKKSMPPSQTPGGYIHDSDLYLGPRLTLCDLMHPWLWHPVWQDEWKCCGLVKKKSVLFKSNFLQVG